ncbi:lycopene cyclase family protein [Pedobacter cryoconitis]|uniref:Lycopene beta-cyclase n=1 Tax=Pedobacter cryoconitis TaxID=188932 RepID=A0A7X0MHD7_9SPHI|nr:lycopene cyclase family protein [Pedobacter cryoconitis]MBB6499024.1 lycopene beta-cyclase [Pedobacter cryoconitis]
MKHFDYIIAGSGCSGRSLAIRMLPYLKASNKQLLLVDKSPKKGNDKTWCFWEKHMDVFEPVVYKKWNRLSFSSYFIRQELNIYPYEYKMIRATDFYTYTDEKLSGNPHITTIKGNVERLYTENEQAYAIIDGEVYSSDYTFSSIPPIQNKRPERYQYLLQHFMGWIIETENIIFDAECATLMDFKTPQQTGTSFVYVLPVSPKLALVEYTVFSEQELATEDYTTALKQYIHEQLHCEQYTIKEQEYGVIPMSDHPVQRQQGRIIYLGTAGGFTKGSTGYTFRFIQKHTAAIVERLKKSGNPIIPSIFPKRFKTYDATLLHLLGSGRLSGEEIFSKLFKKNKAKQILKFLDNETSLIEEMHIFKTLNKKEFAIALLNRTLRIIT